MKPPLFCVAFMGLLMQVACCHILASETSEQPNIVIILADDMGYGDISAYGGWIKTPNLDRLAVNGVRFVDFHSNGAVCSPTRAALVSGKYQQRVGIPSVVVAKEDAPTHRDGIRDYHTTFGELMRNGGYRTAIFGKWHLGYYAENNPVRHGFDEFRGYVSGNVDFFSHVDQVGRLDWWNGGKIEDENGYSTHLITKYALDFLDRNHGHPFCMYVAHEAPHYPYQGPSDAAERVVGEVPARSHGSRSDKKAAYREMVDEMDKGIGQIVERLQKLGIARKTFVFFFSDNGATALGSCGPLRGNKGSIWEGGHRVPAIASWPGKIEPATVKQTAIGMDLVPTMLAIGQVDVPKNHQFDGVDLLGLLTTGGTLADRDLFWDLGRRGSAVRHNEWKLIRTATKAGKIRHELFNLEADLGEQNDVLGQNPGLGQRLGDSLTAWQLDVGIK